MGRPSAPKTVTLDADLARHVRAGLCLQSARELRRTAESLGVPTKGKSKIAVVEALLARVSA